MFAQITTLTESAAAEHILNILIRDVQIINFTQSQLRLTFCGNTTAMLRYVTSAQYEKFLRCWLKEREADE